MNGERTSTSQGNRALSSAKAAKQDEFYTQLNDISNELKHYKEHLRGKIVLCNCDDPYESNFFKYFALNFNALGLKKLICTSYQGSPITGSQLSLFDMEGLKDAETPLTASAGRGVGVRGRILKILSLGRGSSPSCVRTGEGDPPSAGRGVGRISRSAPPS